MAQSLRDELLTIPGIAEAEVEGGAEVPAGVRVRLEQGADPDVVGREVQRVLATHGMRSHMTASFPPPPPGAGRGAVVTLPGVAGLEDTAAQSVEPVEEEPEELHEPAQAAEPVVAPAGAAPHPADEQAAALPYPPPSAPPPPPAAVRPSLGPSLEAISVEEGRGGVIVRATAADGRVAARRARASGAGLDEAVVGVVSELVGPPRTPPLLVAAFEQEIAGTAMITVLVEIGEGERAVGTALLEGGRAYAVARAAWAALAALR